MNIVFVTSEIVPFSKTGGLADVSGALPLALERLGANILIVTPKYKSCKTNDARIGKNIKVHFIENDAFFNRDNIYGDKHGDYKDNLARYSYFSKEVLEYLKKINFKPDVIHCNDWQSSLIPIYLKVFFRSESLFKKTSTLLTIHNIAYQGIFNAEQYPNIGIGQEFFNIECLEYYGKVNLLKGGIIFSDYVNTVSPTHAKEVRTPEFGYGLDGVLRRYEYKVCGILNGIDYDVWDPKTDPNIKKNYSSQNIDDKYENKRDLQKKCGLEIKDDTPLLGIVSRLADQKGIDILTESLGAILKEDLQFVLLGTGDEKFHRMLEDVKNKQYKNVSINLKFDAALAQQIYAGSDIFLMPSKYEPCGLGQMISLKYGTIPMARATGGLVDTIQEFDSKGATGNGFLFPGYSALECTEAIRRAVDAYRDKDIWRSLVKKAMGYDFSWDASAAEYIKLYQKLRGLK